MGNDMTGKWYSERLEAVADELEKLINAARDDDERHYISCALDCIMAADDNMESSGVLFK